VRGERLPAVRVRGKFGGATMGRSTGRAVVGAATGGAATVVGTDSTAAAAPSAARPAASAGAATSVADPPARSRRTAESSPEPGAAKLGMELPAPLAKSARTATKLIARPRPVRWRRARRTAPTPPDDAAEA
jgi:hypothetical protein